MPGRAEQHLPQVGGSACDVPADQVGVHGFEVCSPKDAARQDAVAKSGREALDLVLEPPEHVEIGAVGNMAVSPCGVFALWGARGIEDAWLHRKNEWLLGVLAVTHAIFGGRDFFQASTYVDSRSA